MYVKGGRLTLKMPKNANPALRSTLRVPQPAVTGILWPSIGRDERLRVRHCKLTQESYCSVPRYLEDISEALISARGDTCDGTVEWDVDRPAHAINLKPALSHINTLPCSSITVTSGLSHDIPASSASIRISIPRDVRCFELLRRANVNNGNALLLGKQQLMLGGHLHLRDMTCTRAFHSVCRKVEHPWQGSRMQQMPYPCSMRLLPGQKVRYLASPQLFPHDLPCSRARGSHALNIEAARSSLLCLECLYHQPSGPTNRASRAASQQKGRL